MSEGIDGDLIPSADVLFAENPEQRCPCVLLLDVSGSMTRDANGMRAIDQLSDGLKLFKEAIAADSVANQRVEVAVVTFGETVTVLQELAPVEYFKPQELVASGLTPMGQAIECALELLDTRKKMYKENGVPYYRPWVFLITDGEPTDSGWEEAVRRIHMAENENGLIFFVVGVEPANMEKLSMVAHPSRPAVKLKDLKNSFAEMFQWLSSSMSVVSRSAETGGQIALPPITGWANVATS